MKVLSVRQPWAWALIHGGKDIENRFWKTKYRGPLAIHASKGLTKREYEEAKQYMLDILYYVPNFDELERGAVIGVVDLTDVTQDTTSPWFQGAEIGGKQNYGWVVANPRSWTPLKRKGTLGLRDYTGPIQWETVDSSNLSLAYGRHVALGNLGSSIQT